MGPFPFPLLREGNAGTVAVALGGQVVGHLRAGKVIVTSSDWRGTWSKVPVGEGRNEGFCGRSCYYGGTLRVISFITEPVTYCS